MRGPGALPTLQHVNRCSVVEVARAFSRAIEPCACITRLIWSEARVIRWGPDTQRPLPPAEAGGGACAACSVPTRAIRLAGGRLPRDRQADLKVRASVLQGDGCSGGHVLQTRCSTSGWSVVTKE